MLPVYTRKGTIAASLWLASGIAVLMLIRLAGAGADFPILFFILPMNLIAYVYAFSNFAAAKGYSRLVGMWLALLTIVGLVVLLLLPDKHKESKIA